MIFLSLIVPAYNGQALVQRVLAAADVALRRTSLAPSEWEIILSDDASSPPLVAPQGVRLIRSDENGGPGAARNRGAQAARGAWLLFLDSDLEPAPEAFGRLLENQARSGAAAVMGGYDPLGPHDDLFSRYKNLSWRWNQIDRPAEEQHLCTAMLLISAEVFREVGGFAAGARIAEDRDLGLRLRQAGWTVIMEPEAVGRHDKRFTLTSLLRHHGINAANVTLLMLGRRGQRRKAMASRDVADPRAFSMALLALAAGRAFAVPWAPPLLGLALALLAAHAGSSYPFARFVAQQEGWGRGVAAILLRLLEDAVGLGGIALALWRHLAGRKNLDFGAG